MDGSEDMKPAVDFQRNQRIRHKRTKLFGTIVSIDRASSVPVNSPHITYTIRWDDDLEESLVCPTELEAASSIGGRMIQ